MESLIYLFRILCQILWITFPILATIAGNRLEYWFSEDTNYAGFKLTKQTRGPSYNSLKKKKNTKAY